MDSKNQKYGYILLSRKLQEWEWYGHPTMTVMLLECLLSANYETKKYRGTVIERGSFTTSVRKLSERTGLSNMTVQKCLKQLEECGTIKREATGKYTKIAIVNYDQYQNNSVLKNSTRRGTRNSTQNSTQTSTQVSTRSSIYITNSINSTNSSVGGASADATTHTQTEKNSPDVAVPDGTPQANGKPIYEAVIDYGRKIGKSYEQASEFYAYLEVMKDDFKNWKERLKKWGG